MDLLWPGFLALLGLIPIVILFYIWMLRRRRRFAVRYSSLSLIHAAGPQKSNLRRHLPFALFVLALTSLVLALVRPVTIVPVPAVRTTILLAIDVSRSMCATDIEPNRLEAAKAAALSFVQSQGDTTQIGIVAFAGFAALVQPPTNDQELLEDTIQNLSTARRTAIGSGILEAIDAIAEIDPSIAPSLDGISPPPTPVPNGAFAPAIIVVLTDGVSNVGPHPLLAAQQAADRGVRVYTIGFGTDEQLNSLPNCSNNPAVQGDPFFGSGSFGFGGGGGNFRRGIDEETLMQVAEMTGAEYYPATSGEELQQVFRNLPIHIITRNEVTEISFVFAMLGAALFALALALSMLWNPLS